jgi:hypothetical protein
MLEAKMRFQETKTKINMHLREHKNVYLGFGTLDSTNNKKSLAHISNQKTTQKEHATKGTTIFGSK